MTSREIIFFVSGAAIGIVGSCYYFKKKFYKLADEEIQAIREFYADKVSGLSERVDKAEEAMKDPAEMSNYEEFSKQNKTDYSSYYDHPVDSDEEKEEPTDQNYELGLDASIDHDINHRLNPKIIREDQYGENPYYKTEVLHFYNEDEILTDENDEIIENEVLVVGHCLDKYNFRNDNMKSIWVRNYQFDTDYHIVKIFGKYNEDSD